MSSCARSSLTRRLIGIAIAQLLLLLVVFVGMQYVMTVVYFLCIGRLIAPLRFRFRFSIARRLLN